MPMLIPASAVRRNKSIGRPVSWLVDLMRNSKAISSTLWLGNRRKPNPQSEGAKWYWLFISNGGIE
jgi:hypothetical protein